MPNQVISARLQNLLLVRAEADAESLTTLDESDVQALASWETDGDKPQPFADYWRNIAQDEIGRRYDARAKREAWERDKTASRLLGYLTVEAYRIDKARR